MSEASYEKYMLYLKSYGRLLDGTLRGEDLQEIWSKNLKELTGSRNYLRPIEITEDVLNKCFLSDEQRESVKRLSRILTVREKYERGTFQ